MAIFGNFKGTTQSEFQIGKNDTGSKISSGSSAPSSDLRNGDLYIDAPNTSIKVYNNAWVNVGETLTELNVDNGTLFVNSSNDTVSVGSTSSNEKLFVNGSIRLGTNPSLQHSGAYLDLRHSNGSGSVIRVRDNDSGTDPVFKVYNANNSAEVFKVEGNEVLYSDNVKAKFGTGGDLEIYHDGTNSYIDDAGTGSLFVRSGTTYFQNLAGTKTSIQTNSGGAQTFYHNNSAKLATSSTGISVTGTINVNSEYSFPSADGSANQILVTDGSGTLSFADNSATPGGSNTQIQFNDSGSFNGHANLTYDSSTETLGTTNLSVTNFTYSVLSEDYGSIGETTTVTKDYGDITDEASGDFLNDVVEDTTPQLGGNLDLNSNSITGTGNIDITGTGTFSGSLTLEGFSSNVNEVVVVGTGGTLSSTDNLTIDTANSRVGIGTASPSVKLDIVGESIGETQMRMAQHDDSGDAPDVRFFKSRGTEASPSAVNSGDNLGFVNSFSYDGSSYLQSGAFGWQADGTDADSKFILNTRVGGTVGTRLEVLNTGDVDIKQAVVAKSYKDTVFTITDGASVDIDPDNGGIQVWTLGANRSPTANNFDAGAKVMLMIDDGSSYTITWPSVNWVGGVAPTLATSGYSIIELWKVGSQLYGAFAGGVA